VRRRLYSYRLYARFFIATATEYEQEVVVNIHGQQTIYGRRLVALWNRADHYIFVLWFLSSSSIFSFSWPDLSRRRLDIYHTSTHDVALVRI